MAESTPWVMEASGFAGQVVVEVLSSEISLVLSVETPNWSLTFRLPEGGAASIGAFLQAHAGRASFAECVAGNFFGRPVRLINDDEFDDRLWLRVYGEGQIADFPLVGETARWFADAVAKVVASMKGSVEPDTAPGN